MHTIIIVCIGNGCTPAPIFFHYYKILSTLFFSLNELHRISNEILAILWYTYVSR